MKLRLRCSSGGFSAREARLRCSSITYRKRTQAQLKSDTDNRTALGAGRPPINQQGSGAQEMARKQTMKRVEKAAKMTMPTPSPPKVTPNKRYTLSDSAPPPQSQPPISSAPVQVAPAKKGYVHRLIHPRMELTRSGSQTCNLCGNGHTVNADEEGGVCRVLNRIQEMLVVVCVFVV